MMERIKEELEEFEIKILEVEIENKTKPLKQKNIARRKIEEIEKLKN